MIQEYAPRAGDCIWVRGDYADSTPAGIEEDEKDNSNDEDFRMLLPPRFELRSEVLNRINRKYPKNQQRDDL
jgi:hypothetical protein